MVGLVMVAYARGITALMFLRPGAPHAVAKVAKTIWLPVCLTKSAPEGVVVEPATTVFELTPMAVAMASTPATTSAQDDCGIPVSVIIKV
jgi:hypothetical protein